ncbi:permease [Streptococcus suis]|uniref:permease n=1 Tax=Streptococcus suis TaxID=1307 RepID=UPI001ABE93DE|nr:permease [Streptococcus suis]
MFGFENLPTSILQAGAIFLSIIIEALPFVLIGSILSGFIEVFVSPDLVRCFLPKQPILAVIFGSFVGLIFPSCECGIVPIVNRLLEKKVPQYTAIPFLITAPVINPIVLFATFIAFGNSWIFLIYRALGSLLLAMVVGLILAYFVKEPILKRPLEDNRQHSLVTKSIWKKIGHALIHAIDEFFDTGRYLVFGCLFASLVQVYVPTALLTSIGHSPLTAILLMMVLAFLLSLCSEADAFIGASLLSSFGFAPVMAFLIIGPIVDVKNLLMMKSYFKSWFIGAYVGLVSLLVLVYCWLIGGLV